MVMMFVGGVVLMLDGNFRTIPTLEKLRAGVFRSCPNPYSGKAVNSLTPMVTDMQPP